MLRGKAKLIGQWQLFGGVHNGHRMAKCSAVP
jgi:hypothetical protein